MRVVISARHTHLSEKAKAYAREKIEKLERFDGRVTQAELVLDAEFHGKRDGTTVESRHSNTSGAGDAPSEYEGQEPPPRPEKPEDCTGDVRAAELIVSVTREHAPFVARADGENLYAAVDLVVDKMERQLRKNREKLKDRHRQSR